MSMEATTSMSTSAPSLTIPTLLFAPTTTFPVSIKIPTLNLKPTTTFIVSIIIPTLDPKPTCGDDIISSPSSTTSTSTSTSTIPTRPHTASKTKLAYLAIPLLALVLLAAYLFRGYRRKASQGSKIVHMTPVQHIQREMTGPFPFGTSAELGNNKQTWKNGYRDYRGSAASTVANVKLPGRSMTTASNNRNGGKGRTSAWLGD